MLECGHPDDCRNADDEDDERCEWCEEVGGLRQQLKGIRDQLHKKAVIVTGGSPTIEGDIGYLDMTGGELHVQSHGGRITNPIPA